MANFRILIVDDNEEIHHDFKNILNSTQGTPRDGLRRLEETLFEPDELKHRQDESLNADSAPYAFRIDSAFQGQQALEMVTLAQNENDPYALVFVDMRMPPGWDGLKTIEEIWRSAPKTEIVINTAYSDYSWREIAGRLKVTDKLLILKKPFDPTEAQQIAHSQVAKWHTARELDKYLTNLENLVEEKTLEIERQRANAMQAEHLSSLGLMAGGMAHEINTPLSSVLFLIERTRDIVAKAEMESQLEIQERLENMENCILKISKIIKSLLTFSKDSSQDFMVDQPLGDIVESTVGFCQHRLQNMESN